MPLASTLKVLIVDDQNSVRQMTRMTLEEMGITLVHEAENGVGAFQTATMQPIDLIISDYNMPEMDGLGLLRAVRGHAAIRKLPSTPFSRGRFSCSSPRSHTRSDRQPTPMLRSLAWPTPARTT